MCCEGCRDRVCRTSPLKNDNQYLPPVQILGIYIFPKYYKFLYSIQLIFVCCFKVSFASLLEDIIYIYG